METYEVKIQWELEGSDQPNTVEASKEQKEAVVIDVAVPGNVNIGKDYEMLEKYWVLEEELQREMKATLVPQVVKNHWCSSKSQEHHVSFRVPCYLAEQDPEISQASGKPQTSPLMSEFVFSHYTKFYFNKCHGVWSLHPQYMGLH